MDWFRLLPLEVLLEVFFRLPVQCLGILLQVSDALNRLLLDKKQETFWQEYHIRHFGEKRYIPRKLPRGSYIHQLLESWFCGVQVACSFVKSIKNDEPIMIIRKAVGFSYSVFLSKFLKKNKIDLTGEVELLKIAVSKEDVTMVEILLKYGCDPKSALSIAKQKSNLDIIVLLSPESALSDPLIFVNTIQKRKWKISLKLIAMGVDVTHNVCSGVIHMLAQDGPEKIVAILLEKKVNVDILNNHGYTPLMIAIRARHQPMVKFLLSANANPNFRHQYSNFTPLLSACSNGNIQLTKILLKAGADPQCLSDYYYNNQQSVLHSLLNNPKMCDLINIKFFISLGIKVDLPDHYNQTPLGVCIRQFDSKHHEKYEKLAVLLCTHGANPNRAMKDAILSGSIRTIQFLLDLGATVHPQNGQVPLFLALEFGTMEVIDFLIECGADLAYYNEDGWDSLCSLCVHKGKLTSSQRVSLAQRLIDLMVIQDLNREVYPMVGILDLALKIYPENFGLVKLFIKHGARALQPDVITTCHLDYLELLLVEDVCSVPNNSLWYVIDMWKPKRIILLLLARGADIHCKNTDNETLFEHCKRYQTPKLLEKCLRLPCYPFQWLCKHKVEINEKNL